MEDEILINQNPESLKDTIKKTEPSAVITSDLAANVTSKNVEELDQIQKQEELRRANEKIIRDQQKLEEAKRPPKSIVDSELEGAMGESEKPMTFDDIERKEAQSVFKSIDTRVNRLVQQIDPYSASLLEGVRDEYLSFIEEINA